MYMFTVSVCIVHVRTSTTCLYTGLYVYKKWLTQGTVHAAKQNRSAKYAAKCCYTYMYMYMHASTSLYTQKTNTRAAPWHESQCAMTLCMDSDACSIGAEVGGSEYG